MQDMSARLRFWSRSPRQGDALMGRFFLKDMLTAATVVVVLFVIPDTFAGKEIIRYVLLGLLAVAFVPRALRYFTIITRYFWRSYNGWALNIAAPAVAIFSSLFAGLFTDSTLAMVIAAAAGYDTVCWVYFFCIGLKGLRDNDSDVKALGETAMSKRAGKIALSAVVCALAVVLAAGSFWREYAHPGIMGITPETEEHLFWRGASVEECLSAANWTPWGRRGCRYAFKNAAAVGTLDATVDKVMGAYMDRMCSVPDKGKVLDDVSKENPGAVQDRQPQLESWEAACKPENITRVKFELLGVMKAELVRLASVSDDADCVEDARRFRDEYLERQMQCNRFSSSLPASARISASVRLSSTVAIALRASSMTRRTQQCRSSAQSSQRR
jgi:hypothetical protein